MRVYYTHEHIHSEQSSAIYVLSLIHCVNVSTHTLWGYIVEKSALFGRYALLVVRAVNIHGLILAVMFGLLYINWTDIGPDRERIELDQLRARVGYLTRITTHE